jgi:hypothetical protein
MNMQFLEPWIDIGERGSGLVDQLCREMIAGHKLFGKPLTAIAQRMDDDDVLFRCDDGTGYAVVHLSFRNTPSTSCEWPDTKIFRTFEDWVRDGMSVDHRERFDPI